MNTGLSISWKKIYDFILVCGNENKLETFSVEVLSGLRELCDFDQALVYFLDGNGKAYNQYLMNIDKQWSVMYLEYYTKIDNGRYSFIKKESTYPAINIREWEKEPKSEFVSNYIRSRGLKYSLGFVLFDINGRPRTLFALDKTKAQNFTYNEFTALHRAIPQLNNLHKKFFLSQTIQQGANQIYWETTNLTPRETEITDLLCQGISPAMISKTLFISQSTTNKHIANIYDKMQVSTLQELLVRLLGKGG